jgi:hypothetical protein
MVFASTPRRSPRLARAAWLARLRPRTQKPATVAVARKKVIRRVRIVHGMSLRPRKAGKVIYRQQPQVMLSKPVRKREIFVMTKNPLFLSSVTEQQTSLRLDIAAAAPRECTGWNCVCAAPAGYGEGRLNWCRFYDGLPPLPASPPSTLVARTPTATESKSSIPILSPTLLPLLLAALGVPILPSS